LNFLTIGFLFYYSFHNNGWALFLTPNSVFDREVKRVKISTRGLSSNSDIAAIGVGSMIIFISMLMTAGIAASVMMQTMQSLEQTAMRTGEEIIKDISSGIRVTHVSGYHDGSTISQLAIYLKTTSGSSPIDLSQTYISLSDSSSQNILTYDSTCFSSSVSSGIFGTVNSSNLSSSEFGIMKIRDIDGSCSSTAPSINKDDLVVLMVNTTSCFSGLDSRTTVNGRVIPEYGMRGLIAFSTPSSYSDTIIELQ